MAPKSNRIVLTAQHVDNYFAQLNPIAIKIANDIMETKLNYGTYWQQLNSTEQNDIINETLIKPEISLRYFYNVCNTTTTTASSSFGEMSSRKDVNKKLNSSRKRYSRDESDTSLTAIVFKDLCHKLTSNINYEPNGITVSNGGNGCIDDSDKTREHERIVKQSPQRCPCAFDGRTLRTYALQDVALKVIYDDLGVYRDEHSQPFSFRTRSQINLQLFDYDDTARAKITSPITKAVQLKLPHGATRMLHASNDEPAQDSLIKQNIKVDNIRLQSNKLSQIFHTQSDDICLQHNNNTATATPISYFDDDDSVALLTDNKSLSNCKRATNTTDYFSHDKAELLKQQQVPSKVDSSDNMKRNTFVNYKMALLKTTKITPPILIEQCYNDSHATTGGNGGVDAFEKILDNDSTSGNGSSDDSKHILSKDDSNYTLGSDHDEKYLSEETKLLESDEIKLKRGFDFLNNW